jgi:hypothetical protein
VLVYSHDVPVSWALRYGAGYKDIVVPRWDRDVCLVAECFVFAFLSDMVYAAEHDVVRCVRSHEHSWEYRGGGWCE